MAANAHPTKSHLEQDEYAAAAELIMSIQVDSDLQARKKSNILERAILGVFARVPREVALVHCGVCASSPLALVRELRGAAACAR